MTNNNINVEATETTKTETTDSSIFAELKSIKDSQFINKNMNMAGAIAGAVVAVGLELASPTGSKTSAAFAAVASGATIYYAKEILEASPQKSSLAIGAMAGTLYCGILGGRLGAMYFPGEGN